MFHSLKRFTTLTSTVNKYQFVNAISKSIRWMTISKQIPTSLAEMESAISEILNTNHRISNVLPKDEHQFLMKLTVRWFIFTFLFIV